MPFPINKSVSKSNRTWNYQNFSFIDKGMTLFELFIEGNLPPSPIFSHVRLECSIAEISSLQTSIFLRSLFSLLFKILVVINNAVL